LGIVDSALGIATNQKSPIPNHQSPIKYDNLK